MIGSKDMAPSKERRSADGRGTNRSSGDSDAASLAQRDGSTAATKKHGTKQIRDDGGGNGNEKGNGGNGGDKNKGNNKSQGDGDGDGDGDNENGKDSEGNGNNGNNNNNNNNSNNNNNNNNDSTKAHSVSTTTSIVIATTPAQLPPLAAPIEPQVTPSPSLTTVPTTSITPVISVIETTSVVTSYQMATMTTIIPVMATIPIQISSQPRKGVDGPGAGFTSPLPVLDSTTTVGTVAATATDTTASTTATALAETDGNNGSSNNDKGRNGKKDGPPPGALDPAAEHALIAVGSIGAFVLICFVAWLIYRTLKKSRRGQNFDGGNSGFVNKLPWRRNQNNGTWDNGSMYMANDMPPPLYEKGSRNSMEGAGFYGQEKSYQQQQLGGLTRSNTNSSQRSGLPRLAPGSVVMIPAEQYMAMSQGQSPVGSDASSTLRSRMPDPFFNQSELSRQPSDAYDPARRQVNRASELSSLSSGFGDGDIIIPEEYLNKPQPAATQLRQSNNFITRFSWMSRRDAGDRETVYTTTEERPAKYRSVGSWVNQQTGRLKRSDDRQQQVPPVPNIPQSGDGQGGLR